MVCVANSFDFVITSNFEVPLFDFGTDIVLTPFPPLTGWISDLRLRYKPGQPHRCRPHRRCSDNSYKAEESIAHNWDLLNEALDEFEQNNINVIEKGAEWADVTIRCYLLGSVISDVLDEMEENGDFDESEE